MELSLQPFLLSLKRFCLRAKLKRNVPSLDPDLKRLYHFDNVRNRDV